MSKILIVEDEKPAARRLARLIKELNPDSEIIGFCDGVQSAVDFLKQNPTPDLIMLDIQLGDGVSFDIFKQVKVDCPVIFTTAYDEFAIKAFELNSIDYLLKPINIDSLKKSLSKYEQLQKQKIRLNLENILPAIGKEEKQYKKRFLIAIGERLVSINTDDIAYFSSIDKSTFIVDQGNMYYAIDFSLDKLEELLEPEQFFRINRQFIISSSSIDKIFILSKSRIKLILQPNTKEEILVSNARTHEFREWLDK